MAVIRNTTSTNESVNDYLVELPPGPYDALCTDVYERLNVERKRYQSDETERVDLIAFNFEVTGKSGEKRNVRSREMRISGHEKSALFAFLSSWLGEPPEDGLDTDTLMGCAARLTIAHAASKSDTSRTYVRIADIAPGDAGKDGGE